MLILSINKLIEEVSSKFNSEVNQDYLIQQWFNNNQFSNSRLIDSGLI